MKKVKIWKIIWVVGIYLILAAILYLVVLYKVKWEHKDLNAYLYFYDCQNNLCSSEISQSNYYSRIMCDDGICPFINDIVDEYLILEKEKNMWIYNYVSGDIINNDFVKYRYLDNNLFVFTDNSSKQGIIDDKGNVLIDSRYEYISDYNDGLVAYKDTGLFGVNSSDGEVMVEPKFNDIVLINDNMYAGVLNNMYDIYSFGNNNVSLGSYKYVDSFFDVIFVINNKKIDILTTDFNSTLLMKINTFYDYSTEKERDSLNLYCDGVNIYFDVYTNESEYISYTYNISSKKLI